MKRPNLNFTVKNICDHAPEISANELKIKDDCPIDENNTLSRILIRVIQSRMHENMKINQFH